jgi:hypothetical protein
MKDLHDETLPLDDSGVFARGTMHRALQLASRWRVLEPDARQQPDAVHLLHERVSSMLIDCMTRLTALQTSSPSDPGETDELLEASYMLERLEWCVLHRVPYVERPRIALAEGE